MSVTGSETILLFCEGKPESLDAQLLQKLLPSPHVQTVPCGSKYGLPRFIEGHLSHYKDEVGRPKFIAFRDRDFDKEPPDQIDLIPLPGEKPIFLTHRACIENYFLDGELIDGYWKEKSNSPGWKYGDSPGLSIIDDWISEAAKEIADYQAVRWALAEVKPDDRWPSVETKWTKASGELPDSLNFDDCLNKAKEMINGFQESAKHVNIEQLEKMANDFKKKFGDVTFREKNFFLVWFHGKDLQKALQRNLPDSFSLKSYFEWAIDHLQIEKHQDLLSLQQKINS